MASKLNYSSESMLNIKFSPDQKGYNPLEVDQVLDKVIADYNEYEKQLNAAQIVNANKEKELTSLKEELKKAQFEIASLKKQIAAIPKTNGITEDNYSILKKITAYERVLYRKGVDLKKALSDPDNC